MQYIYMQAYTVDMKNLHDGFTRLKCFKIFFVIFLRFKRFLPRDAL